jgi:hypothetical protein
VILYIENITFSIFDRRPGYIYLHIPSIIIIIIIIIIFGKFQAM